MKLREQQKEERRQAILSAGLDLFIRKGFTATKISDIATAVNMSTGLMFHYYDSKEKLYEELVRIGLEGTKSVMMFDTANPLKFFLQITESIFSSLKGNPFVVKMFVLMAQTMQNEAVPSEVKELVSQVNNVQLSATLMQEGQRQGTIKEGDPVALSVAFWCCIQGIAEELALRPETPCPNPEWVVDMIRK